MASAGVEDALAAGPGNTYGFGPREAIDAARQAQSQIADDSPADVNSNAALARSQALTTDVLGKSFVANADRRDKIADVLLGAQGKSILGT